MSESLNRAAHEAMGYHVCDDDTCNKCGFFPTYSTSLDSAAILERFTIEKVGPSEYAERIVEVVPPTGDAWHDVVNVCIMSAEQRVRACLKALGVTAGGTEDVLANHRSNFSVNGRPNGPR